MKRPILFLFLCASLFSQLNLLFAQELNFKHLGVREGLSQLSVLSIQQDRLGRMWLATEEGLNLYDGHRMKTFGKKEGLGSCNRSLSEDAKGDLYICSDEALIKYDLVKQRFSEVHSSNTKAVCYDGKYIWFAALDSIFRIVEDSVHFVYTDKSFSQINCMQVKDGSVYVGSINGLHVLDSRLKLSNILPKVHVTSVYKSKSNELYVSALKEGVYLLKENKINAHYVHHPQRNSISSDQVRCFTEDHEGNLWIGTFNGLNKLDVTGKFTNYQSTSGRESLSHSSIYSLFTDKEGIVWVGTYFGGANFFNPIPLGRNKLNYYTYIPSGLSNPPSQNSPYLSFPFVGSMVEDSNCHLWICTEGGGLNRLDIKKRIFTHYQIGWKEKGEYMLHNNLKAICYDSVRNEIYIGTHTGGLLRYNIRQDKLTRIVEGYPAKINAATVDQLAICDRLLIIRIRGGIYTMNLDNGKITPLCGRSVYENLWVNHFMIDSKKNLYVCTPWSISRINLYDGKPAKKILQLKKKYKNFDITKMIEASNNNIYIGTRGSGLMKYEPQKEKFTLYTSDNGDLLSDYCYDLAITPENKLMIIGNKGITFYDLHKGLSSFVALNEKLPLSAFNWGCKIYVSSNQLIYVGGVDGLISFKEECLTNEDHKQQLYFSQLMVNKEEVTPSDGRGILCEALPFVKRLDLAHNENNFTLQLANNGYLNNYKDVHYEYRLEGYSKAWSDLQNMEISYMNLKPGVYKLKVREKKPAQESHTVPELLLDIEIHPVFYLTWPFYILYLLVGGSILYALFSMHYRHLKLKAKLEYETASKEHIEELNQAKIDFFTSISHEFRTPLTLIMTQVELLLQHTSLPSTVSGSIERIYKNVQSMKDLVSELITFQRLEKNDVPMTVCLTDLKPLLAEIYHSFEELAQKKEITYCFRCIDEKVLCYVDVLQIKKVICNLLMNSFKFTDKRGHIELCVHNKDEEILIQIIDDGCGISTEDQKNIFELFYRVNSNTFNSSGGVGLALVKKIIALHQAEIAVSSEVGYGTIFTLHFKKGYEHFLNSTVNIVEQAKTEETVEGFSSPINESLESLGVTEEEKIPEEGGLSKNYTILIVDDNEELLALLRDLFTPLCHVLLASTGEEALQLAIDSQPDIILSDVMMPKMSGMELCSRIKNSFELYHIPVVLLTALDSEQDRLDGLTLRADDYITKPFNAKQLIVRCNNLVEQSRRLREKYDTQLENKLDDIYISAITQQDKQFLQRIDEIIQENIGEEDFNISKLAQEVGVSRSSLYNKFNALTGFSPNDYLMNTRLKEGARMLRENLDLQVSEVSYAVGFNSPRYFTRCFKMRYLVSPLEYRKGKEGKDHE